MKRTILIPILFLFVLKAFGQTNTAYSVEMLGSAANGEQTPFWLVNHQWGRVSLDANTVYVRGSVFHEQTINSDWSFDAGIDVLEASSSNYGNGWIQQLYGRLNWKIWRLDMGSREDYVSFLHPDLSSGDFSYSNNARPIPQIQISIPNFILIPYTQGNIYFKGDFSVGKYLDGDWLEKRALPYKQSYTKNVLSHKKSFYLKFGDIETQHKRQFIFGMSHVAQWGGTTFTIFNTQKYEITRQPHGIADFIRVATAQEGSASSTGADRAYVSGSQWGTYTLRYDYKTKNDNRLSAYLQHFFDDGSGMVFENYKDNLIGLELKTKKKSVLSGAVFEYVYTKQQTGPIHHNMNMDDDHKNQLQKKGNGNDNYYNNVDYVQGPSHFGKTIGTPLLLSPEYNTDGRLNFKSNRIIAFHFGVEGYLHPRFQYRILLTTGQSWGRYYVPFIAVKKGVASQLDLIYNCSRIKDLDVKLSLGNNQGEFFGEKTWGGNITLTKRGCWVKKQH
jgi:hypothetical protein